MKRKQFAVIFGILLFLSLALYSVEPAGNPAVKLKRIALVIGNSNYKTGPLKNPKNDARDMAVVLKRKGFEVTVITDANQRKIERAIRGFGRKLVQGGVGLFYYAGHGVQVKGRNFLIPVDSEIESEDEVKYKAVDAGFVLSKMESAENLMNIVILDACRDNPFARSFRTMSRGLAFMDAPKGTLIVYATSPGSTAADGSGRNGLFTKHLVDLIDKSGMEIGPLLREVRRRVLVETDGKQQPWESTSFTGEFYFSSRQPARPQRKSILPPKTGKVDLSDIEAQGSLVAREKKRWKEWQEKLESDINKVNQIDENIDISRNAKKTAWQRVMNNYRGINNPYSVKDEQLLKRAEGRIEFWSRPPGIGFLRVVAHPYAEVIVDGKNIGETPPPKTLKLPEGKHVILLKKGKQVYTKSVYIKAGQTEKVQYSFKKKGPKK